jgi:hypothetical protein
MKRKPEETFTLENILTHEAAFGLTTASPVQRAICRIADGLPLGDFAEHPDVIAAVGDLHALPIGTRPTELHVLSGIRTAKSLFAAAGATRAAITCDLSGLRPGETPRVSCLSLTTDLGRVVFDHLVGTLNAKPALRKLMLEEPTSDSVLLRHPSGRPVEVKVIAGARAGASLVSRWSAGAIFDESPRMLGEEEGIVNFDDARRAVLGRLLPGAQLFAIGSPWAPRGPIYDVVQEHWKKPKPHIVVVRSPATAMNPVWWTPERAAALKTKDEQAYRTDVLAEFADPESSLFSSMEIDRCTRAAPLVLPKEDQHHYVAAIDPATRANAWTLAIGVRKRRATGRGYTSIVLAKQWQGSKTDPLKPDETLQEIASLIRSYGLGFLYTDQHAADFIHAIAQRYGVDVIKENITAPSKVQMYESLRTRIADGDVELPPDPQVRVDLLSIRKRVTMNGIAIELPRTADGRHADYAPAVGLVVQKCLWDPDASPDEKPPIGSEAWREAEEKRMTDAAFRKERNDQRLRETAEREGGVWLEEDGDWGNGFRDGGDF